METATRHAESARLSFRQMIWLAPLLLALHNLEEALTWKRFATELAPQLGANRDAMAALGSVIYLALLAVTLLPFVVAWAAWKSEKQRWGAYAIVMLQAMVLANAVAPHITSFFVYRTYMPGLLTAALVNLPFSVYFLRAAFAEGWVPRKGGAIAVGVAAVLYPVIIGAIFWISFVLLKTFSGMGGGYQ